MRQILFFLSIISAFCQVPLPDGITVQGAVATYVKAPTYPAAARAKQVQGKVDLELTIATDGSVADARVTNGAVELRRAALLAVLQWQFIEEAALARVSLDFRMPPVENTDIKIGRVEVNPSLPASLRSAIESRLRQFIGLPSSPALKEEVRQLLLALDPDLQISDDIYRIKDGDAAALQVSGRINVQPELPDEDRVRLADSKLKERLLSKGELIYPPLARQARIQGIVRFELRIGKDGLIKTVGVKSGHPLLVPAALESVKANRYEPVMRNGQPVEVLSSIDVVFRLVDQQ